MPTVGASLSSETVAASVANIDMSTEAGTRSGSLPHAVAAQLR